MLSARRRALLFISFNEKQDGDVTRGLALGLRADGVKVWCTAIREVVSKTRRVRHQILEAIRRSSDFIILIGEKGVEEESWQDEELEYALLKLKEQPREFRLYVVLMPGSTEKCLPDTLKTRLREPMLPDEAEVFRRASADRDLTEARSKARALAKRLGLPCMARDADSRKPSSTSSLPESPVADGVIELRSPVRRRVPAAAAIGILFLVVVVAIGYAQREWFFDRLEDHSNVDAVQGANGGQVEPHAEDESATKPRVETPEGERESTEPATNTGAEQEAATDPWIDLQNRIAASDSKYDRALQVPRIDNFEPLLRDPKSGLEEFYVVGTGPQPMRGAQGQLEVRESSGDVKDLGHAGLVMVLLPGGTYAMGSADDDSRGWSSERPRHDVTLPPFYLAKTEFTNLHRAGVDNLMPVGNMLERPFTQVDWNQAKLLCTKVGLRLPSESEWEYACRAGATTRNFFGDDESRARHYGWYFLNSANQQLPTQTQWDPSRLDFWQLRLHSVAAREPSPFGFYDIIGNVFEWCEDDRHKSYSRDPNDEGVVPAPSDGSAWVDTPRSPLRVFRGGSFRDPVDWLRSAYRGWDDASHRDEDIGFRPARSLAP